jgi:hypothetical protein
MSKKHRLLEAIKVVANALKNDTAHYDWTKANACNCGLIAQALLGINEHELQKRINQEVPTKKHTWKTVVQTYCPLTGLSEAAILRELQEAGLTPMDMVHLEFLENPAILRTAGFTYEKKTWYGRTITVSQQPNYKSPLDVYRYLTGWIKILEAEPNDTPAYRAQSRARTHERLLQAVASEDYELAATLRNELAVLA